MGLATNTISPATLAVTEPSNRNKGLSGGAIAGIVIGILAFLVIIGLALWFLLRRKRRRESATRIKEDQVDLADRLDGEAGSRRRNSNDSSYAEPLHRLDPFTGGQTDSFEESRTATTTTAGFAGLGAGMRLDDSRERFMIGDEDDRSAGPGVAGPLPLKASSSAEPSSMPRPLPPVQTSLQQGEQSLKNDLVSHPSLTHPTSSTNHIPISPAPPNAGPMRVINHDDPTLLPTLPPGARYGHEERSRNRGTGPTFRRHEDAGRVPVRRREEEIVDLPPLYTDIPRDAPEYTGSSDLDESPGRSFTGRE